jgi:hypothetical protein
MAQLDDSVKTLYLGNSNQLLASDEKQYNIEEYKTCMQFNGPWDIDKLAEIHITKIYNACTMHISVIAGENSMGTAGKIIQSVPYDLTPINVEVYPNQAPKNLTGRIPSRFLPRNTASDIFYETPDGAGIIKSFPVAGINNKTGFAHLMTIMNDNRKPSETGQIKFGFNMSTGPFNNKDASIQTQDISYLTNTNMNIDKLAGI